MGREVDVAPVPERVHMQEPSSQGREGGVEGGGEEGGGRVHVRSVSAGWKHGLARGDCGGVWTWGWGGSVGDDPGSPDGGRGGGGQLGLGHGLNAFVPKRVAGLPPGARCVDASCGFNHTAIVVKV